MSATAPTVHPVLAELLKLLPPPGVYWGIGDREEWLSAVRAVFPLIYLFAPEEES